LDCFCIFMKSLSMDSSYEDYKTWTYEDEDVRGSTYRVAPRTLKLVVNDYVPKICDMEYQPMDETLFEKEDEDDVFVVFAQSKTTQVRQQDMNLVDVTEAYASNYKQSRVNLKYEEKYVSEKETLTKLDCSREAVDFDVRVPQREGGISLVQGNSVSVMHGTDVISQLYEEIPFLQIPEDVMTAVSENYGIVEMAQAIPMSYDDRATFSTQQDFDKYKDWIKYIESNYHPVRYDNRGCFVIPKVCSLEKKANERAITRQDLGKTLFQIINSPKQESVMKRVSDMGYMELLAALCNRYGFRRIVNVRIIRRLMRKLYYKMDMSSLPCVRNKMRYLVASAWQVIIELLMYGVDVCWHNRPYDIVSQSIIEELYDFGMLPIYFKGSKFFSMRGNSRLNKHKYCVHGTSIEQRNMTYSYVGMGEIMECVFFFIPYIRWRVARLVCRQWCVMVSQAAAQIVHEKPASFRVWKKNEKKDFWDCNHAEVSVSGTKMRATPESCLQCVPIHLEWRNKYLKWNEELEKARWKITYRDLKLLLPFLDKAFQTPRVFFQLIQFGLIDEKCMPSFPAICFVLWSVGFRVAWIEGYAMTYPALLLHGVLRGMC